MTHRPTLERWLQSSPDTHPLKRPDKPDFFLDAFEAIIAPIDAAQPLRLPTKIKALRTLTTDKELLEQRAELLIGSLLARSEVAFEFAEHHPDYVLGGGTLGIEVGSRAIDGPWALHDRLEEMLTEANSDRRVQLSFDDRPLKLGAARITEIAQSITHHETDQPVVTLRFEAEGLSATLTQDSSDPVSQVSLTFGGGLGLPLAGHMSDIERELANKVAEKKHQSGKMPTILMVDMARTGWSWMRGPEAWIPAMRKVLDSTPWTGLGVFVSELTMIEPLRTHMVLADPVDPQVAPLIEQVASALHLSAFQEG